MDGINFDYNKSQEVLLIQRICQILIILVGKEIPKHEIKPKWEKKD